MNRMTPRDLSLQVLNKLTPRSHSSLNALEEEFRSKVPLSQRDRAFVYHLVHGVLRWRMRLDWIIGQASHFPLSRISPVTMNILRMALYQIFFMDRVPESAAVNEAVKQAGARGARRAASFVNGTLRNICRAKDKVTFPDPKREPIEYLSVFHSYPAWLVEKWVSELGIETAEALLSAGNRIPRLTLRANTVRTDRASLIKRLADEGVNARPTAYSPSGITLEGFKGRVDGLRAFKEGLFQVQDEAAQVTAYLLGPSPGDGILDVCAGLGGKTTHLAEIMRDRGRVLAVDISHERLQSLVRNAERLGIRSIAPVVTDATRSLPFHLGPGFSGIVVDAPCSGLGVISRHPDGKWNRNREDIPRLAGLQEGILSRAASLLRKGGRVVYVTCTISREENEEVIRRCLRRERSLVLEDLRESAPEWAQTLIDRKGFLRTLPHLHDMDGFFCALLRKK